MHVLLLKLDTPSSNYGLSNIVTKIIKKSKAIAFGFVKIGGF